LRQSGEVISGAVRAFLGLLLIKHPEVEQTTHEAQTLLVAAAEAGYWKLSILLGIPARDGRDTSVDKIAAVYHLQVAVLQGGEEAKRLVAHDLERLNADFERDELANIISSARAGYGQHRIARQFINDPTATKFFPYLATWRLSKRPLLPRATPQP
jgi:hypothetical protein